MDMEANGQPDSEAIRRLEEEHRHYSEKLEALLQNHGFLKMSNSRKFA